MTLVLLFIKVNPENILRAGEEWPAQIINSRGEIPVGRDQIDADGGETFPVFLEKVEFVEAVGTAHAEEHDQGGFSGLAFKGVRTGRGVKGEGGHPCARGQDRRPQGGVEEPDEKGG